MGCSAVKTSETPSFKPTPERTVSLTIVKQEPQKPEIIEAPPEEASIPPVRINSLNSTVISFNHPNSSQLDASTISNYNIEKDVYSDSNNPFIITVNVRASKFETMYPIWIAKDTDIGFEVSGEWNVNEKTRCSSDGITSTNTKAQFPTGALIGRVLGDKPFHITSTTDKYHSTQEGPLFIRMNINNVFYQSNPSGNLKLVITNATPMSLSDIDEKLGWGALEDLYYALDCDYKVEVPKIEKETMILINKMRTNSKLFAVQYLNNISSITPKTKKIYDEMCMQNIKYPLLKTDLNTIKLIKDFYVNSIQSKSKKKAIMESKNKLKKFIEEEMKREKNFSIFIKEHDHTKSMSLAIRLLLDDDIRSAIFNINNKEISMLTLRLKKFNVVKFITICVFSDDFMDFNAKKRAYKGLQIIEEEKNDSQHRKFNTETQSDFVDKDKPNIYFNTENDSVPPSKGSKKKKKSKKITKTEESKNPTSPKDAEENEEEKEEKEEGEEKEKEENEEEEGGEEKEEEEKEGEEKEGEEEEKEEEEKEKEEEEKEEEEKEEEEKEEEKEKEEKEKEEGEKKGQVNDNEDNSHDKKK